MRAERSESTVRSTEPSFAARAAWRVETSASGNMAMRLSMARAGVRTGGGGEGEGTGLVRKGGGEGRR